MNKTLKFLTIMVTTFGISFSSQADQSEYMAQLEDAKRTLLAQFNQHKQSLTEQFADFIDNDPTPSDKSLADKFDAAIRGLTAAPLEVNDSLIARMINTEKCDQVLDNKGFFSTCFSYDIKGPLAGHTLLRGDLVNHLNIEERMPFYADNNVPKKYRIYTSDYVRSGFDRSHTIANDASFDWSSESLNATYAMTNILPHYPNTNRQSILAVEKYERLVAVRLGSVNLMVFNTFPDNPQRIGKNKVAVPDTMWRVYWSEGNNFERCFRIPNDDVAYRLKEMETDCTNFIKEVQNRH